MRTFDIVFDLIFGISDRVIYVEVNIEDSQLPKESKHSNDSTITDGRANKYS